MVIREMTKVQKRKRKMEKGPVRPMMPMMPPRMNVRQQLNALRGKEMARIRNNMNMMGTQYEVAERYAIFSRPENTGKGKKR